jgi:hypothetical protein
MNTVTGMEAETNNDQNISTFQKFVKTVGPWVLPCLLAAEPTTKWGWMVITVISTILGLVSIVNLILSFVLKKDNKYKKILNKKPVFIATVVNFCGFFSFLAIHMMNVLTNSTGTRIEPMKFLFGTWKEGGTGAFILNVLFFILRAPLGLLYFTSGGFAGRALSNKFTKTIGTFINPQVTTV